MAGNPFETSRFIDETVELSLYNGELRKICSAFLPAVLSGSPNGVGTVPLVMTPSDSFWDCAEANSVRFSSVTAVGIPTALAAAANPGGTTAIGAPVVDIPASGGSPVFIVGIVGIVAIIALAIIGIRKK